MKRLNQCSKHDFIRLFFALCTLSLFVAAVLCPDRARMFDGLKDLLTHTCKVPKNTFACSSFAGAFLNSALVSLACTLLSTHGIPISSMACRYSSWVSANLYLAVGKPNSSAAMRRIASRFIVKKAALAVGITR